MLVQLLFVCLSSALVSGANLPGGIKPCKNDNKLKECILKASNDAIKNLVKGEPKAGVPVLDPLHIPKIEQSRGGTNGVTLNLTLENIDIIGLTNAQLTDADFDTTKKHFKVTLKVPKVKIASDYVLNGKFLVVPVTGKGKGIIYLDDPTIMFYVKYKLEKKKGSDYIVLVPPPALDYKTAKMSFKFDNLFNGDKALGDNLNKMLNENWQDANNQLGPGIAQGIAEVLFLVLSKVASPIPFKQVLL